MRQSLLLKRTLDVIGSALGLVIGMPFLLLGIGIARLTMGSPVLFRQRRPGLFGKPFILYKLRTMCDARDSKGELLPDHERLTSAGRLLRRLSIDELPQLWNVLRGDMSLVGPRPLRMRYLPLYTAEQRRRHDVLPGITGWAQVHGRNTISWEEKFELDVWYVDHWTIWLDIRILFRTVGLLLAGAPVSEPGHATSRAFEGSVPRGESKERSAASFGPTNRVPSDSGFQSLMVSRELGGVRH